MQHFPSLALSRTNYNIYAKKWKHSNKKSNLHTLFPKNKTIFSVIRNIQSKFPSLILNPYTRNVCDTLHETLRAFPEMKFEFSQREYLEWTDFFFLQKLSLTPAVLLQVAAHTLFTQWTRGKALLFDACALNRFLFIFSSNKGDLARGSPTLAEIFIIGIKNSWLWLNDEWSTQNRQSQSQHSHWKVKIALTKWFSDERRWSLENENYEWQIQFVRRILDILKLFVLIIWTWLKFAAMGRIDVMLKTLFSFKWWWTEKKAL